MLTGEYDLPMLTQSSASYSLLSAAKIALILVYGYSCQGFIDHW